MQDWLWRHSVDQITAEELFSCCVHAPKTAAGLDGWSPADWALLPVEAFGPIAKLLNSIESGAPWPDGVLHGKATFLSKTDIPSLDFFSYRILLILCLLYRRWGMVRLRCLRPWMNGWFVEGMFAGFPGLGAEDAWYETALRAEYAFLQEQVITGGMADIFKCFDQVSRYLLGVLLLLGGMPRGIVFAYFRFHDQVLCYNSLAGGFGKPYQKRCSIPQGCPFSMMLITFLLRTLAVCMHECYSGVVFRMLADDILLLYIGVDLNVFVRAYDFLLFFLASMGGKVAPNKSATFSTDNKFRGWLRQHVWNGVGAKIKVQLNFRDLGAHLNFPKHVNGSTLTGRMLDSISSCFRIKSLPHSYVTKATFIAAKTLNKGLYGCESTSVNESVLAQYTTAISNTVAPNSSRKSNALVFSTLAAANRS